MVGRVPSRPLRILFFVREPPYVQRIYGPLVAQLTERGHEVELAFAERTRLRHADRTVALFSGNGVRHCFAPRRKRSDGWRSVAWLVRGLGDLARYTHPRYEEATRLRRRVT